MKEGFGYNGEEQDGNGLIYLRARYYNPELGRFIQIDSFKGKKEDVESQNRYIYTNNNPYKYTDKNGHAALIDDLGYLLAGLYVVTAGTVIWVSSGGATSLSNSMSQAWDGFKKGVGDVWDGLVDSYNSGKETVKQWTADTYRTNPYVYYWQSSSGMAMNSGKGTSIRKDGNKTLQRPRKSLEQLAKELCDSIQDIYRKAESEAKDAVSKSVSIATSPALPNSNKKTWDLDDIEDKVNDLAPALSRELIKSIAETVRRGLTRNKNSNKRMHHIVLKSDSYHACAKSREILISVDIDPKPYKYPRIANIAQSLHGSLHLNTYKDAAYKMLYPASLENNKDERLGMVLSIYLL